MIDSFIPVEKTAIEKKIVSACHQNPDCRRVAKTFFFIVLSLSSNSISSLKASLISSTKASIKNVTFIMDLNKNKSSLILPSESGQYDTSTKSPVHIVWQEVSKSLFCVSTKLFSFLHYVVLPGSKRTPPKQNFDSTFYCLIFASDYDIPKDAITVHNKHGRALKNTRRSLQQTFWLCETKSIDKKNHII